MQLSQRFLIRFWKRVNRFMKLTPEFVDKIVELFINAFNGDMLFLDKHMAFDHMGWFEIEFRYLPLEYDVIFKSDMNLF